MILTTRTSQPQKLCEPQRLPLKKRQLIRADLWGQRSLPFCDPRSFLFESIRIHSRLNHLSEIVGAARPHRPTGQRSKTSKMQRELQRPAVEAKPDWHGRNGVKAIKTQEKMPQFFLCEVLCVLCASAFRFCPAISRAVRIGSSFARTFGDKGPCLSSVS